MKVIHLLLRELPAGYRYPILFLRRPTDEVMASQAAVLRRNG